MSTQSQAKPQSFHPPFRLRAFIGRACLGAGLPLMASPLVLAAQSAEIEEIVVVDEQRGRYEIDRSSMNKFTESLLNTPQSITTISDQLMEDRGAMSLSDALRNVPGITLGAGEFSWQGNNPTIRGFSSRNDMFLDGMRDFGNYYRDPFNLSSVEVLQGPSSMIFGRGSTGGVINQVSKTPLPDPLRSLHVNVGNADTRRITADINEPLESLGDGAALRLNLLKHEAGVAGRNGASADHVGIAPSLSLGLGSATQLTLSFLKQEGENTPDYGLPWMNGRPAPVERETFYGFGSDFVNTDAEITTLSVDHQINPSLAANVKLRYADYWRESRITEPQLADPSVPPGTALDSLTVERQVFRGESTERMAQAQFNLMADVSTGVIDHALVGGMETAHESSAPTFGFGSGVPSTTLVNPPEQAFSGTTAPRLRADTNGDSLAAYVLDTITFNEFWQLMGGIRWDRFDTNYIAYRFAEDGSQTGSNQIVRTDIETSYRAALVYKPVAEGTVYLGWGTSFNPSSEGLSFISSGRNLTISNANLAPETNESVEVGLKWELFGGTLAVDSALFHITKDNARVPDPANPGFNILAGRQVVDGLSLNLSGRIGQKLQVSGGYTYLDSQQEETTAVSVAPDSPLQNVAENTFSLWLNYAATTRVQVGAGTRYVDERLATISMPTKSAPDYWTVDAMARFEATDHLSFKLNLTNLGDEYYFDQLHPWHVIPGPGFTSVFAVNFDY